jgi:hypothetical protein
VTWHVLTGEYPPQPGGVSDYTRQVARGLAEAGDRVEVWAPPCDAPCQDEDRREGVTVHRLPDRFGVRSFLRLNAALDKTSGPRRLLVQYVPQAFGCKGANLPFCIWLRSRRREPVWIMFHEVLFDAGPDDTARHRGLALANRWMASLAAGAAERAFVSIPGWRALLEPLEPAVAITWLPVPSSIPVSTDPAATAAIRRQYACGHALVGHFGTYGSAIAALLERTLVALSAMSDCHVVLIGENGDAARRALLSAHPQLAGRLFATGRVAAADVSHHVAACDLMVQPYPDGVSTRRTSAMVALAHGRPLVTTSGRLTEPFWASSDAAVLAWSDDPEAAATAAATLLLDATRRAQVGQNAARLYDSRFDVRHSVAALRSLNGHSS